jgi:methionyl-tRNA formyltransferase
LSDAEAGPAARAESSEASAQAPARRLRVIYCTRGGLFGALVLRRLRTSERLELCGIVRSCRNFNARFGFLRGALAYIHRSGIAYSLYLFCATSVADVLCAFGGIRCVPTRTRPGGVPVHTTRDINDAEGIQFLQGCKPDLLISAFFDQRLEASALAVPSAGCVNIHPSLLPEFKGVDPVLQARIQEADPIGVTVHRMVPTLDAGDILAQRSMAFPPGASVFEVTAGLFREGAELLAGQFERLARAERGTPQQSGGSYQSWPTRSELRVLRSMGGRLIRFADLRGMLGRGCR